MEDYVRETNQRLALLPTPTRVVDWFHSTGNFVVKTSNPNRWGIVNELSLALGVPCAVLTKQEVTSCIAIAEKASSPLPETGIRWTKGIAFKVKGRADPLEVKPTSRAVFFCVNNLRGGRA